MSSGPAPTALEDAIVELLNDRLETALELVVSADAIHNIGEITRLCREAATVAAAGRLLLAERS